MRLVAVVVLIGLAAGAFEVQRASDDARREAEMWSTIGEMRLKAGDDLGARDAFGKSIELDPKPHTYVLRSFANWRLMDYRASLTDMEPPIVKDPANAAYRDSWLSAFQAARR